MMNDTEADWGDASVSVTVMVTRNRPSVVGVPLITPPLKLSPGASVPVSDQWYGPLPPEAVSDSVYGLSTGGCRGVPGLVTVSVGYEQATLTVALALWADGDVTTSVSVICHWFDAAVTESGTLTDPPAGIFTCVGPVLVWLERAQW
jgi:hypothetical protein